MRSTYSPFRVPQQPLTGLFTLSSAYIMRLEVISVFKEQKFVRTLRSGNGLLVSRGIDTGTRSIRVVLHTVLLAGSLG